MAEEGEEGWETVSSGEHETDEGEDHGWYGGYGGVSRFASLYDRLKFAEQLQLQLPNGFEREVDFVEVLSRLDTDESASLDNQLDQLGIPVRCDVGLLPL